MFGLPTINWLAVLVTGVVYMAIGFIWYSMRAFGGPWSRLIGISEEDLRKGAKPLLYLGTFALALVGGTALAVVVRSVGATTVLGGFKAGLLVAVGFVLTTFGSEYIFSRRPFKLYLITAGYQAVAIVVNAIILAVWR
ncbi:MAG TPA: DUF1761 domain-containing protein [Anaerolineales bacterium]|nr:DUF1761 domain-containing protein [Anaerolineales bacterium]